MKRICVYCGANPGNRSKYRDGARQLGRLLAGRGLGLVYGGATVGLMGVLADAALEAGAEVIGIIPEALMGQEVAHFGLTDLKVVTSMHERKALMAAMSDGFIALPGGLGTLEETFEILTWAQLGIHAKPCGLLNVGGYFDGLVAFLDHAVDEGFIRPQHRELLMVAGQPELLLDRFEHYHREMGAPLLGPEET